MWDQLREGKQVVHPVEPLWKEVLHLHLIDQIYCIAQADYKAKNAAQCDVFLKRKKVTTSNKALIFQHIKDKELEIIEYDTKPLSFYWIMMQYIGGLGMVPEDVQHKQVKEHLFIFVHANVQCTKVRLCFLFPYLIIQS